MRLFGAIATLALAATTATARSIIMNRTSPNTGLTTSDNTNPYLILYRFEGSNCDGASTATIIGGPQVEACFPNLYDSRFQSFSVEQHGCYAARHNGCPELPVTDGSIAYGGLAGGCSHFSDLGEDLGDLQLVRRCLFNESEQAVQERSTEDALNDGMAGVSDASVEADTATGDIIMTPESISALTDRTQDSLTADSRYLNFLQFAGSECTGEAHYITREGGQFGDPMRQACIPIRNDTTRVQLTAAEGCVAVPLLGGCWFPEDNDTWLSLGFCDDISLGVGSDRQLSYKCDGQQEISSGRDITIDAPVESLTSRSDESSGEVSGSSPSIRDTLDVEITTGDIIVSPQNFTEATDRAGDSLVPTDRYFTFFEFTGSECQGPASFTTINAGKFGDPSTQDCSPISDESTRVVLAATDGCVTTILLGGCDIPIGFDNWMEVSFCENIEVTGRSGWSMWYRCDGR